MTEPVMPPTAHAKIGCYDLSSLPEQARADIEEIMAEGPLRQDNFAYCRLRAALNPPTPTLAERIKTVLDRDAVIALVDVEAVLAAAADELAKQPLYLEPGIAKSQRAADVAYLRGQR